MVSASASVLGVKEKLLLFACLVNFFEIVSH